MNGEYVLENNNNIKESIKGYIRVISIFTYLFIKRLFDIVCSLFGVLLLIPIMTVIKIISIISGDFNSIMYSQERIGMDGKVFYLYKFRTMVPNADKILEQTLNGSQELKLEWIQNQKLENDPRITKVGKIIRKLSIDEVPQFVNILMGDMSLIGPRPLVKGELDNHDGNHDIYESVKPGITGWWACNGRSATTYEKRLELEYYYVNNRSLLMDIKCILGTVKAVIKRDGAK